MNRKKSTMPEGEHALGSSGTGTSNPAALIVTDNRPLGAPNVIQLRCSICDRWRGNGGRCVGKAVCLDFVV